MTGGTQRQFRLERGGQLDNMLINGSGPSKPAVENRERRSMRTICLALLLAAGVTPAFAQDKTFDLKISHWVPASHPLQKSLEDWAVAVEKDSGGTIKGKVFPAQQLGKAF